MAASLDLIVKMSHKPASLVIVGIGNEDFSRMKELNNEELIDSDGNKAARGMVHFVHYKPKAKGEESNLLLL